MDSQGRSVVYVVDDDAAVRRLVSRVLETSGIDALEFGSADAFLTECNLSAAATHCLLLDIGLPGMDGLSLQRELLRREIVIPIIILTGLADISLAVRAIQAGALDVLEKPVCNDELRRIVEKALQVDREHRQRESDRKQVLARLATLSEREREIMDQLSIGKNSKELAAVLGIGTQTILKHRAKVLRKLQVRNEVELVRLLASHELIRNPGPSAPPVPAHHW
jgi:two-component system response regulator FixJ